MGDNFSGSSILSFLSSLHKNVCLWEQSDFEMEFDILLHEYHPFDCVLQFGNVRCDVTSENPRQMYESTPFCLVNNKVLDLGKYCDFDRKLIGCVSFIHSSAIWTIIVLPLHFFFKAGLHVRRKHKRKRAFLFLVLVLASSLFTRGLCLCLRRPGSHVAYACACAYACVASYV